MLAEAEIVGMDQWIVKRQGGEQRERRRGGGGLLIKGELCHLSVTHIQQGKALSCTSLVSVSSSACDSKFKLRHEGKAKSQD